MKRSLILIAIALACALTVMCMTSGGGETYTPDVAEATVVPQVVKTTYVEIEEHDQTDSDEQPETEIMYFTEDDVITMAKILYLECRGIPSDTQKACVVWTVLNRVDCEGCYGDTVTEVATAPSQFAYSNNAPVLDELYELASDVLTRWNAERNGETSVGRVLPTDYCWFSGDGTNNHFRNAYNGNYSIWDYSLPSPYES